MPLPLRDLQILPGLFDLKTARGVVGRWKTGNKIRFHNGMPQKIGGWRKSGSTTFTGICRNLIDWLSLNLVQYIALATHLKLYVRSGLTYSDITPIRSSGTYANDPFAVVNLSTTVTVTHTSHGALLDDYVTIAGASAGGGITVDGEYQIQSIVDANTYTITHGSAATSTDATTGGAAATYAYQINVGKENSVYGLGWGVGPYGASTYGTARSVSSFLQGARTWSMDLWGEDLIACPRGGGVYVWDTSVGTGTRAAVISGAPTTAKAILVSPENKHLVVLGAHDGSASDPLLIRWSSSEDYTSWTAASTNTAGNKRLNTGNEILCGIKARKEILVFTDSNLWAMTWLGTTSPVFGFEDLGEHGGLRGPNAAIEINGRTYWMGEKDFFTFDGGMRRIACDVWHTIFDDINHVQKAKVHAAYVRRFGEIWWFYCSASSSEIDRYVSFNPEKGWWSYGTMARTAYIGDSDLIQTPYAAGTDGYLYDHESGTDDDTSGMTVTLDSGDIDIGDGDAMMFVNALVPDFRILTGSITLTLKGKRYPHQSAYSSSTAVTMTSATELVNPRLKARQISLSFSSSVAGDHWEMGTFRIGTKPYGRK